MLSLLTKFRRWINHPEGDSEARVLLGYTFLTIFLLITGITIGMLVYDNNQLIILSSLWGSVFVTQVIVRLFKSFIRVWLKYLVKRLFEFIRIPDPERNLDLECIIFNLKKQASSADSKNDFDYLWKCYWAAEILGFKLPKPKLSNFLVK